MRNLLLAFTLLLIVPLSFSQNLQSDFSSEIEKSGVYLQKASSDIIMSASTAVLSGACLFWANSNASANAEESIVLQNTLAIGFAIVSVGFYVAHIVHIRKAGDHLIEADRLYKQQQRLSLSLQTNHDGIGLAINF